MRVKDAVGRFGEQLACQHLEAAGLRVIERNWRCPDGELDVVALDAATLVFVEVKTRSTVAFGHPAEAVDRVKAGRVRRLAVRWLEAARVRAAEGGEPLPAWSQLRFDVVSVVRLAPGGPEVTHLRGAF